MSTQVDPLNLGRTAKAVTSKLDKANWSDLQHIQYLLGIWDGIEGHPVIHRELPEWKWVPNDRWRKLRGLLSDRPEHNTTASRKADREWELKHDTRKFGS